MRSRAPHSSPVSSEIEDAVGGSRKELTELGVDAGAATIQWHSGRQGVPRRPSGHDRRVLCRRGFVAAQPRKRPHSFRPCVPRPPPPTSCGYTHCIDWVIATGVVQWFLSFLHDLLRVALRSACPQRPPTPLGTPLLRGHRGVGVLLGQLSDNGLNFSWSPQRLRGCASRPNCEPSAWSRRSPPLRPPDLWESRTIPADPRNGYAVDLSPWTERTARPTLTPSWPTTTTSDPTGYRPGHPAQRWAVTPPAINLGVALPDEPLPPPR